MTGHDLQYHIDPSRRHAHLYGVELHITQPTGPLTLSLPVWIPGSYMVREFAQHLQGLTAEADGQPVRVVALNKTQWRVVVPSDTTQVVVRYQVYAWDTSVRTAFLDAHRGFFNPTSVCLRVDEWAHHGHRLHITAPPEWGWRLATALPRLLTDAQGFGTYRAADYDELADSPVEMGTFWSAEFEVRGVPHRWVVSGAPPGWDGARLVADTARICEAAMTLWHGSGAPPFDRYVFMLHATPSGYGGLEHRHSTALICQRSDLPMTGSPAQPTEGYTTLLGLISHEYFHAWNVKRLRPQALATLDYQRENYTDQLWFFEGFTSYYDDLLVLRAGLIDEPTYLRLLSKTINQVLNTPGRHVQSVAQASFDAWIKYYRVNENTPNATVSYYTKGALVALCLDLTLRAEGHTSLDDVMRALYQRCQGGPMGDADLRAVLQALGQRPFDAELDAWVHGIDDRPLQTLLQSTGIHWNETPAPLAQQLGVRVKERDGLVLTHVLRDSAAEAAGLAAGDEWIGLECPALGDTTASAWRVRTLDEVGLYASGHTHVTALVARDGRLLRCPLAWPKPTTQVQLNRPAPEPH